MLTKTDLSSIRTIVKEEVKSEVGSQLKSQQGAYLKPIKDSLRKIEKRLDTTIRFFDRGWVDHDRRIKRIEENLHLQSPQ